MNNIRKMDKVLKSLGSIATIVGVIIGILTFINTQQEKKTKEITELLELAKFYYEENDYEGVAMVYSDEKLQKNAEALRNVGVMYAKGIYYSVDEKEAICYFQESIENGDTKYSLAFLLQLLSHDDMDKIVEMVELGCEHNSKYCEKLLQDLYEESGITCNGGYIYDFSQKTKEERKQILEKIFLMVGSISYDQTVEVGYKADVTTINGEEMYTNVEAYPTKVEKRSIGVFIKRYFGESEIRMVFE